jgi:putative ABC transport system permease protein
VLEGSDLESGKSGGPPQALVNRTLAKELDISPGAELWLRGSCGPAGAAPPATPFRVSGIAAFPFEETGERAVAVDLEGYHRACADEDPDEANLLLVASREGAGPDAAIAAIRRVRPDLHAFTNEQIVARFARVEFSYFRQISSVLASLTLFFGFLLITVLLTVSVNQRLGEIATLRALGFSRGRVVADVLCQAALLVGSGGLLALPLGLALSSWLDAVLKAMPELPANLHFFVFEPRALGLHAALLSITAVCAALYPMWLVSRLEIATTLRNEVVS